MNTNRIDVIRHRVKRIGEMQLTYHRFFHAWADRFVDALGDFLGATDCVLLANLDGPFDFDQGSYRHEGLGFDDNGRYTVPVMVKMRNLEGDGSTVTRVIVRCVLGDQRLKVFLGEKVETFMQDDLQGPCRFFFDFLLECFNDDRWFASSGPDYQTTRIGFI